MYNFNSIVSFPTGYINSTVPDATVKELRRAYYSATSWTDSLVGRVLDQLDKLGLADNTIVSFFGDHGWQLGEHGEWSKSTNFDIATHAPMMIRIPGLTDSGPVTEKLTEFVDLYPTLVEAAGLPALPLCPDDSSNVELCREGSSLMPLIHDANAPWKNASFSQYPRTVRTHGFGHRTVEHVMGYSMKTDSYRYTEWAKLNQAPTYKPDWNTLYGVELYDHSKDPDENYNVAGEQSYAHLRQQLSQQLRAGWRNSLPQIGSGVIIG